MTGLLVSAALFALACLVYYRGRFLPALLLEALFLVAVSATARCVMAPAAAWTAIALLSLLPAALLLLHLIDARFGVFLVPTIYSIAVAAIAGPIFLAACALALLR